MNLLTIFEAADVPRFAVVIFFGMLAGWLVP